MTWPFHTNENIKHKKYDWFLTSWPFHTNVTACVGGPSCLPFSTIAIRSHVAHAIAGLQLHLYEMLFLSEEVKNAKGPRRKRIKIGKQRNSRSITTNDIKQKPNKQLLFNCRFSLNFDIPLTHWVSWWVSYYPSLYIPNCNTKFSG